MMMDLLGLPFTSIVLFILAGIVLGHALWYQDRSSDIEKINWLERRYLQARTIASRRKGELQSLTRTREQQQYEHGTLRQRYGANLVQFKALERSAQAGSQELQSSREQHRETAEQLSAELRRNEMLVSQLQEVLRSRSGLESQLRQQTETMANLAETNPTETNDWSTALQTLRQELTHSRQALKLAAEDLAARSSDLDLLRSQRDSIRLQLEQLQHFSGGSESSVDGETEPRNQAA